MLIRDIFTFAFDALKERKLRAALTILGIAIGPAAIVALIGATEGFSQAVSAQFDKMGVTTISVMPVGRGVTLTATDVETLQKIEGVNYVIPLLSCTRNLKVRRNNNLSICSGSRFN